VLDYSSYLNPRDIWLIRQNKPSLIARDLQKFGIPPATTYSILLGRGVFKWLAVRRDLIRLKDVWKGRVRETLKAIREAKREKDWRQLAYLRGYLKAYEEARAEIRKLCHSDRFRAPDFDRGARKFLEGLGR